MNAYDPGVTVPVEFEAQGHRWWVDPAHEAFVRAHLEALAGEPKALPGAEVVKDNRMRTVVRASGPEGRLYVKRFRVVEQSSRWLHLVKPSSARREWEGMLSFAEAGIQCPRPVILGEERRGGFLHASVLATLEVEGSLALDREIDRLRESGDSEGRRRICAALARACWAIFQNGVDHPDMHAGNFLLGADGELVAVDLHSVRRVGGLLGPWLRRRRMGKVAHSLAPWLEVGAEEVCWLADTYAEIDPALGDAASLRRELLERGHDLEEVRLASRGKRCLLNSTGFAVETAGALKVYRRRKVPQEAILAALDAEPLHLVHEHSKGRTRIEVIAAPPGLDARGSRLIRKRYLYPSLRRRLATVHDPAPLRAWKAARACEMRVVPAPYAFALVMEGRPLLRQAAVIMELIEDADMVHCLLLSETPLAPVSRRRLARDLGAAIGHFHSSGLKHRDLAMQNLLVRPKEGDGREGWDVWIVDLDEVTVGAMSRREKLRSLAQMGDLPGAATRTDRLRAFRAYLQAGGDRVLAAELEELGALEIGRQVGVLLAQKAEAKRRRMARKARRGEGAPPTDLGALRSE